MESAECPGPQRQANCCTRCAQKYQFYPDLECIRAEDGCLDCRRNNVSCVGVPRQLEAELDRLQRSAQTYHQVHGRRPDGGLRQYLDLKDAQEKFNTALAHMPKGGRKNNRDTDSSGGG